MFTVGHRPGNNDVSQGWGEKKKIFVGPIHLTPSGPTSERGLMARGGPSGPPPTKSMKEWCRTLRCYLEIGPYRIGARMQKIW